MLFGKKRLAPMSKLSAIAARDIGLCEDPKGSNKGKQIQKFFDSDDLDEKDGYPWCASAVSYWVQQWIKENGSDLKKPQIAGVARFPVWAKAQKLRVSFDPRPNDIVIFTFSHIGVVESVDDQKIVTIEGNTNDDGSREGWQVCRKNRKLSECKLFISLPA